MGTPPPVSGLPPRWTGPPLRSVALSAAGGVTTDPSPVRVLAVSPLNALSPSFLANPTATAHRLRNRRFSLCKLVTQRRRLEPARLTYVYVEHPRGVGRPDCVLAVALHNLLWQRSSSTQYARIVPSDDYTQNCDRDTSPPPSPHTGLIGSTWAGTLTSLCSDPTLTSLDTRAQPLRTRSDYTGGEGACASSIRETNLFTAAAACAV